MTISPDFFLFLCPVFAVEMVDKMNSLEDRYCTINSNQETFVLTMKYTKMKIIDKQKIKIKTLSELETVMQ